MLRFYEINIKRSLPMNITISPECIMAGEGVWKDGKEYFKRNVSLDIANVQLVPIENADHEVICYACQDNEANRELRMLRELQENKEALQFEDIFPGIKEVIVCGCNELAYHFVKYLEKRHINVTVTGEYWEWFGYKNNKDVNLYGKDKFVVHAEGINHWLGDLYQTIVRSSSPEFECVDEIYEANVQAGKINDTKGKFISVLEKLKGKDVVILGIDARSQDTYDLLYANGIDIWGFVEWEVQSEKTKTLLGKKIIGIKEAINHNKDLVLIDGHEKNSALGNEKIDFFDYYGFVRNENFFLISDYTNIPCSNLLHVLKDKNVWLAGDEKLCRLLFNYLKDIELGKIDVQYAELSHCVSMKETDILCIVHQWYHYKRFEHNPRVWSFRKKISDVEERISYTDYFSYPQALVKIDLYMNRNDNKYSMSQLIPKGILLGRIPHRSGNTLLRGLLDGHPDIVKWDFGRVNTNLFLYCIRLANEEPQNIIKEFEEIYREEQKFSLDAEIIDWDLFKKSMEDLLSLKDKFSSQELFVLFHIAYAEMMSGKKITDIGNKIIYWEPHHFSRNHSSRNDFPFLAQWLEDEKINGQTIFMHRDNIVWTGTCYKPYEENEPSSLDYIHCLSREDIMQEDEVFCQNWKEFHMRFEDLKLHPQRELMNICDKFNLTWSDTMMCTTKNGEAWGYRGVFDFDVKPVFNKYEEYLSEFDRFRISLLSSPYQKRHGYTYESSMKFSRSELRDMFLKKFRFQEKLEFTDEKDRIAYQNRAYELLRQALWKVRKHEVLNDIRPLLSAIDIGQSASKKRARESNINLGRIPTQEDMEKLINFVKQQKKLILYGIGRDCEALLERLGNTYEELLFSDLKASYMDIFFHGSKVIAPTELCKDYCDYNVFITSSRYCEHIKKELEELGVGPNRIICNTFQLWGDIG